MGLYINENEHPGVFKNMEDIPAPNQGYFHVNTFSEMIKEQKRVNTSLFQSFQTLQSMYQKQENNRMEDWQRLTKQLDELKENDRERKQFEMTATGLIGKLHEQGGTLEEAVVQESEAVKKIIADKVGELHVSNQGIDKKIAEQALANKELSVKINRLLELQEQLSGQIGSQNSAHQTVMEQLGNAHQEAMAQIEQVQEHLLAKLDCAHDGLLNKMDQAQEELMTGIDGARDQVVERMDMGDDKLHERVATEFAGLETSLKEERGDVMTRLESHEALLEKSFRQLNYLRSILFERTNHLVEKIEENYHLTSSYIYKLVTGTDQPLSFLTEKKNWSKLQKTDE